MGAQGAVAAFVRVAGLFAAGDDGGLATPLARMMAVSITARSFSEVSGRL